MVIVLILALILVGVESFVIYNMYKKFEVLEDELETMSVKATEAEDFIFDVRNRVMSQRSYLKQLDNKGAFESDDEVGYFFKELKKIINDISVYFDMEPIEDVKQNEPFQPTITGRF